MAERGQFREDERERKNSKMLGDKHNHEMVIFINFILAYVLTIYNLSFLRFDWQPKWN